MKRKGIRIFNGKKFKETAWERTKREAQKRATKYKQAGFQARVIDVGDGYAVYTR